MKIANSFDMVSAGLYPEVLPPCFVKINAEESFSGIAGQLDSRKFHDRPTGYARYSGTKHDGGRRFYGTPNIVSYYHVAAFLHQNQDMLERKFSGSSYAVGTPQVLEGADRAIRVPSLSQLSSAVNRQISYAPFILKADIAQCFPSLYTHAIAWAAHGIEQAKKDTTKDSTKNSFNALDFHVRNCQRGNTRGVLIGPDAFRIVAEFLLCQIDVELEQTVGAAVIGAVRHVDDYYIGLRSEHDAQSVLSHLRNVLASYELHLNDQKTRIFSSLEPINDLWAQRLRSLLKMSVFRGSAFLADLERSASEAVEVAKEIGSDSPVKIFLRELDDKRIYADNDTWGFLEPILMRIAQKHGHALDYVCLLVAKRKAIGREIDDRGWREVVLSTIKAGMAFGHTHEICWMLWLGLFCRLEVGRELIDNLVKLREPHILAMVARAYEEGRVTEKPKFAFGSRLETMDHFWLPHLVAKTSDCTRADFSGNYAEEFRVLACNKLRLLDFGEFETDHRKMDARAISRTRYGYDDPTAEEEVPEIEF